MTFFDYLNSRYQALNHELQLEYTLHKEGQLKAAYSLIQWQRSFYKIAWMPTLIMKYILINMGWLKLPEKPVITEPNSELN